MKEESEIVRAFKGHDQKALVRILSEIDKIVIGESLFKEIMNLLLNGSLPQEDILKLLDAPVFNKDSYYMQLFIKRCMYLGVLKINGFNEDLTIRAFKNLGPKERISKFVAWACFQVRNRCGKKLDLEDFSSEIILQAQHG